MTYAGHLFQFFIQISTHTSLAGRDTCDCLEAEKPEISTHTSLAGRDDAVGDGEAGSSEFYSHVPRGT